MDHLKILDTEYSETLRTLYNTVRDAYKKPLIFSPIEGRADNSIEVMPDRIEIRLRPGSSEDNIAHELMHAILQSEGYPRVFSAGIFPADLLRQLIASDLDPLIINERLLRYGYDAQRGYLRDVDPFNSVFDLRAHGDPDSQALLILSVLHELLKFVYYVGDDAAEDAILAKFPQARKYWDVLVKSIRSLPKNCSPGDIWKFIKTYLRVADQIGLDCNASFVPSEIIGFSPVPLGNFELTQRADRVFYYQIDNLGEGQVRLRTFLKSERLLVSAQVRPRDIKTIREEIRLTTPKFAELRRIQLLTWRQIKGSAV